jgi:hypothetical protein
MRQQLLLLAAFPFFFGCEAVDSQDVLTSGVYADLDVTASGTGLSVVQAVLRVGGKYSNAYLSLSGDDTLTATVDGETRTLYEVSLGEYREYATDFQTDAADTAFQISFDRTVDPGAPDSQLSLPAPFELTGPADGSTFSRNSDDLLVEWSESGSSDSMRWEATGDCIDYASGNIDGDEGVQSLEAGTLESSWSDDEADEAGSCTVTLTLWRSRSGTVDNGFGEGGEARAHQVRTIEFTSSQ